AMSPSRQPPETAPATQRNRVRSMRAPGRRTAEPSTHITVATRCGSQGGRSRAAASTIDRSVMYTSQKLVQRDRQVANALAGRVIHGIGKRRANAGDPDLADALRAERVYV